MWVRLKDFHQQHPEVTYYTLCEWSCNDKLGPYLNRKGRLFNANELLAMTQRWLWMKTNKAKPGFYRLKNLYVAWLQQYMNHYSKTDEYTEDHKLTMLPRLEEYLDSVGMGSVEIVAREQLRNEDVGGIVNMPADIVVNEETAGFPLGKLVEMSGGKEHEDKNLVRIDRNGNVVGDVETGVVIDLRGYSINAPEVKEQPTDHLSKAKYDFYVGVPPTYPKLDDAGFPTPLNTHDPKQESNDISDKESLKRQAILDQCRPVAKSMGEVPVYDSIVETRGFDMGDSEVKQGNRINWDKVSVPEVDPSENPIEFAKSKRGICKDDVVDVKDLSKRVFFPKFTEVHDGRMPKMGHINDHPLVDPQTSKPKLVIDENTRITNLAQTSNPNEQRLYGPNSTDVQHTPTPDIILGAKKPRGTYQLAKGTITASDFALEQKQYGPSIAAFMYALKPMQDKIDALGASVAYIKSTIDNMPSHSYLDAKVADLASSVADLASSVAYLTGVVDSLPTLYHFNSQVSVVRGDIAKLIDTFTHKESEPEQDEPILKENKDEVFMIWYKELNDRLKHIACELVYRTLINSGYGDDTLARIKSKGDPSKRFPDSQQDMNDRALFEPAYKHHIRTLRNELNDVCGVESCKYMTAVHLVIFEKFIKHKEVEYNIPPKTKPFMRVLDGGQDDKRNVRTQFLNKQYGAKWKDVVRSAFDRFDAYLSFKNKDAEHLRRDSMLTLVVDPLQRR